MTALAQEIGAVPAWYHTIDVAPGLSTPGYYDLRPMVDRLPWPEVQGKRCLDVGSHDGFYAFELLRRGAAEVVAIDVPDRDKWDWPPDARETGMANAVRFAGPTNAPGFEVARKALGVDVRRELMTVYELDPERLGSFDVVVCGSLLLHLRDPLRALEAIRSVCTGWLLSVEEIQVRLSFPWVRAPLAQLNGSGQDLQWMVPSARGHRRMLFSAGFATERRIRPFMLPFGISHSSYGKGPGGLRGLTRFLLAGRAEGVPHTAVLARPRL